MIQWILSKLFPFRMPELHDTRPAEFQSKELPLGMLRSSFDEKSRIALYDTFGEV